MVFLKHLGRRLDCAQLHKFSLGEERWSCNTELNYRLDCVQLHTTDRLNPPLLLARPRPLYALLLLMHALPPVALARTLGYDWAEH